MKKQWTLKRPDPGLVEQIQAYLHCHRVTATILANRRIQNTEEAQAFVDPSLDALVAPFDLKDMQPAVERIEKALVAKEKILVFGDYDVDGVTATVAVFSFLKSCGARVDYHIPHRIDEGYSIQSTHVDIARPAGVGLIITVDCGSASHDAVAAANSAGIDVIVTDHHQIDPPYPDALAVINPQRQDCHTGLEDLAGVGVAFSLLVALRRHLRAAGFWQNRQEPNLKAYLDLVALGTIADMVPMRADNRILTHTGLGIINHSPRPGISALVAAAGIGSNRVTAEDIAFRLAPRINAAGRMAHARIAAEMLITRHPRTAAERAETLNTLNAKRQETEQAIIEEIEARLAGEDQALAEGPPQALVIAGQGWHEGVLGIVASKLTQKHHRPTVVIAFNNGRGKGSARSIPGLNLYECLGRCAEDLKAFGSHAMAAGLQLEADRLARFEKKFEEAVAASSVDADLTPRLSIDCELYFNEITPRLVDEIEALQPFGSGNQPPLFMAQDIVVVASQTVGQRHRRFKLRQRGNRRESFNAIWFNVDPGNPFHKRYNQIAFRLQWNRWNGTQTIQLLIEAVSGGREAG
jgi:single-stranded-DNA-specific exonuclease